MKNPKQENRSQMRQERVVPHPSPSAEGEDYNKRQNGQTGTGSTFATMPDSQTGQVVRERVMVPKKKFPGNG